MKYRVQAFLTTKVTGLANEIPYAPTFHRTRWGANRQQRALFDSFGAGMVYVQTAKFQRTGMVPYEVISQARN